MNRQFDEAERAALSEVAAAILQECEEDDVGLWWIVGYVQQCVPPNRVQEASLHVVEECLKSGRAVLGQFGPNKFVAWNMPPREATVALRSEWEALGREPGVGDIAWLVILPAKTYVPERGARPWWKAWSKPINLLALAIILWCSAASPDAAWSAPQRAAPTMASTGQDLERLARAAEVYCGLEPASAVRVWGKKLATIKPTHPERVLYSQVMCLMDVLNTEETRRSGIRVWVH